MSINAQNEELLKDLDELIKATTEGKIIWHSPNPTTFSWYKRLPGGGPGGGITIQYVDGHERRMISGGAVVVPIKKYIFTVFDPGNVQRLTKDSGQEPDVQQKLQALFECIGASLTRRGLDYLKSILPT